VNEKAAEKAFSNSPKFLMTMILANIIIKYKRQRVRDHPEQFLKPIVKFLN
jgi:hypothetical protein